MVWNIVVLQISLLVNLEVGDTLICIIQSLYFIIGYEYCCVIGLGENESFPGKSSPT